MRSQFGVGLGVASRLFALSLLGVCAPVLRGDATADNAEQLARFQAVAFGKVKSASVARIVDPRKQPGPPPIKDVFYHYVVVSNWRRVDPGDCTGLAALLRTPIAFWVKAYASAGGDRIVMLSSFCLPDPGYAVRLDTDEGPRDFLICLQCGEILAFGGDKTGAEFGLDPGPLAQLKEYYQKELGAR